MTIKAILQGNYFFDSASLSHNATEQKVIYTVPGGARTLLKEIRVALKGGSNLEVGLYILKSGGSDSFNQNDASFDDFAYDFDVMPLSTFINSEKLAYTLLVMNTILEDGDTIKIWIRNKTGSSKNVTIYGANIWVGGDES